MKTIGLKRILYAVVGICQVVVADRSIAADEQQPFKRWAVVASKELQSTGLADLLTAQLSQRDGFQLVERDQLELATKELELAAVAESTAAGKRLKLGRLLKADALLLLSSEQVLRTAGFARFESLR